MRHSLLNAGVLRCLVALAFLPACTAGTNGISRTAAPLDTAARGLPFPDERAAQGLTENLISGKDTETRSGGAVDSGTAVELDATGSVAGMEYAVYRFNPGTNAPDSVSVLLEQAATTGAFIGLANYATLSWDLSGPHTQQKTFAVDDGSYLSPGGSLWVAVFSPAGESATVNALSVRTINPNNVAPTADLSAGIALGVAPLGVGFDASLSEDSDGSIIEYAWDWNGDNVYDSFSDVPQAGHVFTAAGQFTIRVRVTDDQFARATDSVALEVWAPPVAELTILPAVCNIGELVVFSASGSSDTDGAIASYAWDLDGNGTFETSTGMDPQVTRIYTDAGQLTCNLRVMDDDSLLAFDSAVLVVHGWNIVTVEDTAGSGQYCSLADINGVPAISYHDGTSGVADLKYAVSSTPLGTQAADWDIVTVDSFGFGGIYTSLALVDGCPAIGYYQQSGLSLSYARATTAFGALAANWSQQVIVDDTVTQTGIFASMAVISGNPALAYMDSTNSDLRFARSSTAQGALAGDWVRTPVDTGPDFTGAWASLAQVNGVPAIAYHDGDTNSLMYVRGNADGSSWSAPQVLDPGPGEAKGLHNSLQIVNGFPAIAYAKAISVATPENFSLLYVRAQNAAGTGAWGAPVPVLENTARLSGVSLHVIVGVPAVSVGRDINSSSVSDVYELYYVQANDINGADWADFQIVDAAGATGNAGEYTSLAQINGHPGIAYYDDGNGALKYAVEF